MIPITIGVRKFGRNIRHHAIAMTMKMRAHSTKVIWLNVTITQSKKGHDSRPLINKNKAASHGPNTRQVYGSAIHNRFVTRDEAASKIRAGYAGALAGWILGAPHDGKTDWTSVTFYDPANPKAELPPQAVFVQNLQRNRNRSAEVRRRVVRCRERQNRPARSSFRKFFKPASRIGNKPLLSDRSGRSSWRGGRKSVFVGLGVSCGRSGLWSDVLGCGHRERRL